MSRKKWEKLIAGLAAVLLLAVLSKVSAGTTSPPAPETTSPPAPSDTLSGSTPSNSVHTSPDPSFERRGSTSTNALVIRSVDGDTFHVRLDSGEEATVRFLGVNTPETVDPRRTVECFGKEASAFTKASTGGKRVRLEADPQADEVDKYGRLLRNVFLEDGTDFNASLVGEGYAYAYVDFPQSKTRKAELLRLQDEARDQKRGLWADGVCVK